MSQHDANSANADSNADSLSDAKSAIALVVIIVITACFWLTGQ